MENHKRGEIGVRRLLAWVLSLLLLAGCAAGEGDLPGADYAPAEEQRLVVYTSHKEEVWRPIVKEFEERTGIWVDVVYGGTNELLEQLAQEEKAPRADVMFGGGVESLATYEDCFTPYDCAGSEHILEQFRAPGQRWIPFSALPLVLIYNTKLAQPEQITGWSSLLEPELRGSIAFSDPAASGSSYTALVTMLDALGDDRDGTLRRFADNLGGVQLDSSGNVLTAVAGGDALVGVTLEESALKRIAEGLDIAMVYPADGTSCVPDGSALVKGAPHEDNARRFLDFTVSAEVQELLVRQFCRRSVRDDVAPMEDLTALDELPMVEYDLDRAVEERDAILMSWAFYFGEEEP